MPQSSSSMNICRLCGCNGSDFKIFPDGNFDCSKWATRIDFTLGIKVKRSDKNKTICLICKQKVLEFFEFKSGALSIDAQNVGSSKEAHFPVVTIKDEPDVEKPKQISSFGNFATAHVMPLFTMSGSGQVMPWPAMVPFGTPIPLPSLNSTSTVPFIISPPSLSALEPQPTTSSSSSICANDKDVSGKETASNDAIPEEGNVDDIVLVNFDDKSDSDKNSGKFGKNCKKMGERRDCIKSDGKVRDVLKNKKSNSKSALEAFDKPLSHTPSMNRARRGQKRRGSSNFSSRSVRSRIEATEPMTSERSCGRSLQTRPLSKKIVDSSDSSDDGDCSPDDPGDPSYCKTPVSRKNISDIFSSVINGKIDKSQIGPEIVSNAGLGTRLPCKFCPRFFQNLDYLRAHESTHNGVLDFTCVKCDVEFPSITDLENHEDEAHGNETWHCFDCLCGFYDVTALRNHKRNHCRGSKDNSPSSQPPDVQTVVQNHQNYILKSLQKTLVKI